MLSKEQNDILCRVGPDTPMGTLMRQYWIPGLLSTELRVEDGAPLRLRLLGEDLIAFRATSGKVGVIQNACPHRGASMFFGRNEEEGLRCVYHGWKFDTSGACVDMPSEPAESNFKNKVRTRAYPTVERNGVIWTYMGTRETPPPPPNLEPNMVEGPVRFGKVLRECNWMQALEGDIDTSHFNFLHGRFNWNPAPGTFEYYMERDKSPKYAVTDTEFGTSYGAYRPAEPGTNYWRIAHFLFPFYTMIPTGVLGAEVRVRAWIPVDDGNTMWVEMVAPRASTAVTTSGTKVEANPDARRVPPRPLEYEPDTTGWLGKWRLAANAANDYKIDREAQHDRRSYTGIDTGGALLQDQAITESMGQIYDRSQEHLGTSDAMVIRTRRRLINAAVALRDDGLIPPGVDNPAIYETRSGGRHPARHGGLAGSDGFVAKGVHATRGREAGNARRLIRHQAPQRTPATSDGVAGVLARRALDAPHWRGENAQQQPLSSSLEDEVSMDFFEVVHTQRSIRKFKPDPVPQEAIWKILDAAIRAPSGSNTQPWAWLVVQNAVKRKALADAVRARMGDPEEGRREAMQMDPTRRRMRLASIAFREDVSAAPCLIIPCLYNLTSPTRDVNSLFAGSSIYGAIQNMMLAARAIGLGTVLTTFNTAIEDTIRSELNLPDDAKPVAVVPLGYPDGQSFGPTTRKPVESVTFFDGWDNTRSR